MTGNDRKSDIHVAGYAIDGDIYCVDCAREMTDEEEYEKLQNDTHEAGGPVFYDTETESQYHCGRHKDCVNSTTEHLYGHNEEVGQPIEETVLDYLQEWDGRDPEIHHNDESEFVFTVDSNSFKYKLVYEKAADKLSLAERTNKGTTEISRYGYIPDGIEEYAREVIQEGREVGEI